VTTPPRIEVQHVSKSFVDRGQRLLALEDVSFRVEAKEFVTLIGPSGSGKSTLFNLIVGLQQPDQGTIALNGVVMQERTGQVGYMPQRDLLFPWRSVLDNAIVAQEVQGVPREAARERARSLLPSFGLESFADAYPSALSGGMRQRAALLRTVLTDRDLLLLDEPFGALDALTRRELQDWLLGLWGQLSITLLFITHDVEEALYLGDRVLVFAPRPGRILDTVRVSLARPRRQGMVASPQFGSQAETLLRALGVRT
jgi:ABC-type nitrate/sulfonate/bicarbonate transport system ATPase subunit